MRLALLLTMLLFFKLVEAQEPTSIDRLENSIESLTENSEENADLSQIAENINHLLENPLLINFASEEELSEIPFLDIFQIYNLINYRDRTGGIYSKYELMVIKGFNKELILKLLPFLDFRTQRPIPDLKLKKIQQYSRHSIIARYGRDLQTRKGYLTTPLEGGYLGSPNSYNLRYKSSYKDFLSSGFNLQQDAGEPFNSQLRNSSIDFFSAYVHLKNYGRIKSFIIGDFNLEFGQGLNLWSSFSPGKSILSDDIKKYARGIRSFSGSEENRFFRGTAITYRISNLDVSAFYSNKDIDANVSEYDSINSTYQVSSTQSSGLHRTFSEIEDRHSLGITTLGANVNYKGNNKSIGVTTTHYRLDKNLLQSDFDYKKFQFSGNKLTNLSLDFNYLLRDINCFGEVAYSDTKALASSIGIQTHPSDQIYFNLLFRYFSKRYQSLYSSPFAENANYGEKGTYMGLRWSVNEKVQIRSYLDVYQFLWSNSTSNFPSLGMDLASQCNFNLSRYYNFYIRFKSKRWQENSDSGEIIPSLNYNKKNSLRLHFSYFPSLTIRLNSRVEFVQLNSDWSNKGNLFFQDIQYRSQKRPYTLSLRYALSLGENYDSRIYAYENDLSYTFSVPAYYGKSTRFYILASYKPTRRLKLEAKYSITSFRDREVISSGLSEINGPIMSQLRLQIFIKI